MPYRDVEKRRAKQRDNRRLFPDKAEKWRRSHPVEVKKRLYAYRVRHELAFYLYNALTRLAFPERYRAYSRKADKKRANDPGRIVHASIQKAKRRHQADVHLTARQEAAMRRIYGKMRTLRQWFDVEVDHKMPLARGGFHEPSNLQIIYARENREKGARLDYVPSVIFA